MNSVRQDLLVFIDEKPSGERIRYELTRQEQYLAIKRNGVRMVADAKFLERRVLEVLEFFGQSRGVPFSRDRLRDHFWRKSKNPDASLNTYLLRVRSLLDDEEHPECGWRLIQTMKGGGLCFGAPVVELSTREHPISRPQQGSHDRFPVVVDATDSDGRVSLIGPPSGPHDSSDSSNEGVFSRIRVTTLCSQISEAISERIIAGELKPGEILRQMVLARQFMVSQTVIREALIELEANGLVTVEGNRRARVRNLTKNELCKLIDTVIPLEILACKLALTDGRREFDLAALETSAPGITRGANATAMFHRRIWDYSNNSLLKSTLDQLSSILFVADGILRDCQLQYPVAVADACAHWVRTLRIGCSQSIEQALRSYFTERYRAFLSTGVQDLQAVIQGSQPRVG